MSSSDLTAPGAVGCTEITCCTDTSYGAVAHAVPSSRLRRVVSGDHTASEAVGGPWRRVAGGLRLDPPPFLPLSLPASLSCSLPHLLARLQAHAHAHGCPQRKGTSAERAPARTHARTHTREGG
eukprot:822255-Rhodomonas_salina.1